MVKLPTFLAIECKPYDRETFMEELENEDSQKKPHNPEAVIRWREVYDEEGNKKKESNTRIVKWSDGSSHLFLGDEAFEVVPQDIRPEYTYLYVALNGPLKSQGQLETRLTFRPTSLRSKAHQKFALASQDKLKAKGRKVKMVVVDLDPEEEKKNAEKAYDEKIKTESAQRKMLNKYATPSTFNSSFLEEDEEEEDNKGKKRTYNESDETEREKRILSAKQSSSSMTTSYTSSAQASTSSASRKSKRRDESPPRSKGKKRDDDDLFLDDEEDLGGGGGSRKNRRRARVSSDDDE
eukprot:TRINITY_DN8389_c0_g1_i1.p1 TRINITY_DN8389_c0_g1~~TRINITY_DN8389_c0_g1_i1.p1  ORF type:complete len:294 (-),score=81.92 TRINITY_DN8389_c0_g1_i1:182-1063(-)